MPNVVFGVNLIWRLDDRSDCCSQFDLKRIGKLAVVAIVFMLF